MSLPVTSAPARILRCAASLAPLAAAWLAGCAPRARPATEPELIGASAGYSCAYRRLRDLGYTLTRTAPEAGIVAGQRIVSRPLAARTEWDELTVTAAVGADGRAPVRAVARGGAEQSRRRTTIPATSRGRRDAGRIAEACRDARRGGGR